MIELVQNDLEQARSRALCEAAVEQAARDAGSRDFSDAVPDPRHRLWAGLAAAPVAATMALGVLYPAAASNAWARVLAPWKAVSRYTFAAVAPLPDRLVVAPRRAVHGHGTAIEPGSPWKPARGEVRLGERDPIAAPLARRRATRSRCPRRSNPPG